MKKIGTVFGGEGSDAMNALLAALEECAMDDGKDIYAYLDHTPKTSLIVELCDKLKELGFDIVKEQP